MERRKAVDLSSDTPAAWRAFVVEETLVAEVDFVHGIGVEADFEAQTVQRKVVGTDLKGTLRAEDS